MTATISDLINKLEGICYTLYLDGERVKFRYGLAGEPPFEAKPLLDTLREHKAELIDHLKGHSTPIPYDTLKTCYLDAFNRTGWKIGLMARPEVIEAEDRLNQIWLDCMEGKASMEDFKRTLNEWEGVISGAIRQVATLYGS